MDKQRILELADVIEKAPYAERPQYRRSNEPTLTHFNMSTFHCGSAGCIAGWTIAHWQPEALNYLDTEAIVRRAAAELDLSPSQAEDLFCSDRTPAELTDIRPAEAARVLRHFVETGEIEWESI